jgi:MFS family permease
LPSRSQLAKLGASHWSVSSSHRGRTVIGDGNRKWWILAAMGGTLVLVVLDETIVGVALPTIRHDLAMDLVASHWIVSAYLVVFAGLAAAAGKISDLVDIRTYFDAGVLVFAQASEACAFALNGTWLIAAHAVQGIGAAIIFPTSVAMLAKVFPPEQRGLAFGIHVAFGGTFMALGPLTGGVMIRSCRGDGSSGSTRRSPPSSP